MSRLPKLPLALVALAAARRSRGLGLAGRRAGLSDPPDQDHCAVRRRRPGDVFTRQIAQP